MGWGGWMEYLSSGDAPEEEAVVRSLLWRHCGVGEALGVDNSRDCGLSDSGSPAITGGRDGMHLPLETSDAVIGLLHAGLDFAEAVEDGNHAAAMRIFTDDICGCVESMPPEEAGRVRRLILAKA